MAAETEANESPEAGRSGPRVLPWVGAAISIGLIALLFRQFDLGATADHLADSDYRFAVPVLALGFINFALRAARWGLLFPKPRPAPLDLFNTNLAGYFANTLLPARAGELVRVVALAVRAERPPGMVLGTVLVERVLEVVILLGLIAAVLPRYTLSEDLVGVPWIAALGLAGGAGLVLAATRGEAILAWILPRLGFLPTGVLEPLERIARSVLTGVSALRDLRLAAGFLAASAAIWLLELGSVALVARAVGLSLGPVDSLFLVLVVGLGALVPSSPANLGTFEWAALFALAAIGIEGDIALSMAILLHASAIVTLVVLGGVAWTVVGAGGLRAPALESERS